MYIHVSTKALWPAASVNARVPWVGKTRPAERLDATRAVDQMTWLPGRPQLVMDPAVVEGGILEKPGARVFNTYTAPPAIEGEACDVDPYLEHVLAAYPTDVDHILDWLAHRAQRPAEKINHALVLGGAPGIGKDTLLAPAMRAAGEWNCAEVSPSVLGSDDEKPRRMRWATYEAILNRISERQQRLDSVWLASIPRSLMRRLLGE